MDIRKKEISADGAETIEKEERIPSPDAWTEPEALRKIAEKNLSRRKEEN